MTDRNVRPIIINNHPVFVEVVDIKLDEVPSDVKEEWGEKNHPDGSEPGENASSRLKTMISSLCSDLSGVLQEFGPSELSLEAKVSFGGKANPIPFLVSTATEAALTVKVTWKK